MATKLSGQIQVNARGLFSSGGDTSQEHDLGGRVETSDGRVFRYVFCTPTALVAGNLLQGLPENTNHQNRTVGTAAAIGDTVVEFSLGAAAAGFNQYAGGYLIVTTTPGNGYAYKIKGHAAIASSGAAVINLEDPIQVALTTSSVVDLVVNPYSAVRQMPTTATSSPIGAAVDIISAGRYGWVQTKGPAALLAAGALSVGNNVQASTAIAGAVSNVITTAPGIVGYALTGVADTENGAVFLTIG